MKAPEFTKDVVGGIEAIRSKIVTTSGVRLFKILNTDNNKKLIQAIGSHAFILDMAGESTGKPDDEVMVADLCDALRYIGQNLFPVKGPAKPSFSMVNRRGGGEDLVQEEDPTPNQQMLEEIKKRTGGGGSGSSNGGKKGGFFWRF